jgi:formylglycine-generating enzyme required for sulfatase activity
VERRLAALLWATLAKSKDAAALSAFVTRFPETSQATLCKDRLDRIQAPRRQSGYRDVWMAGGAVVLIGIVATLIEQNMRQTPVPPVPPPVVQAPAPVSAPAVQPPTSPPVTPAVRSATVTRLDPNRGAKPLTDAELAFVRGVTQPLPDQGFKECAACPEMVVVPPGEYLMGSPDGEEGRETDEGPQHKQTIPAPFAVGRTHVTRGEFAAFAKATNHKPDGGCHGWTGTTWELDLKFSWRDPGFTPYDDRHPVVCVNAKDAEAYVAWLNEQTPGKPYRLLSEAEAEYAARGVTKATAQPRYFFGNEVKDLCTYANGADETAKEKYATWPVAPCRDGYVFTAPVGSFKANAFGLRDVHGNAWTWTADCWNGSYKDKPAKLKADGGAWTTGDCDLRVLRGGSSCGTHAFSVTNYYPQNLRSAYRSRHDTASRDNGSGFRVARTITP